MWVRINYFGVIVIWSTTPLAIQWSGQGLDFVFAALARMLVGLTLTLLVMALVRMDLRWHRQARQAYLAAGMGIYGSMLPVYWAAQYIPSGWLSVLFGLTPIVTGLLASRYLGEDRMAGLRLVGLLMGLAGLATLFDESRQISVDAQYGVAAMLLSVIMHSLSSVAVKRVGYEAHGLEMTAGGLLVALPLYLLTWLIGGAHWPDSISVRTLGAILYLGGIATVIGFAMYYYVLRRLGATRVALLTLITPMSALWLGHMLNGESITPSLLVGTLLILAGLAAFEWDERRADRTGNISS